MKRFIGLITVFSLLFTVGVSYASDTATIEKAPGIVVSDDHSEFTSVNFDFDFLFDVPEPMVLILSFPGDSTITAENGIDRISKFDPVNRGPPKKDLPFYPTGYVWC